MIKLINGSFSNLTNFRGKKISANFWSRKLKQNLISVSVNCFSATFSSPFFWFHRSWRIIIMNEIEKKILQHLLPLIQFSKMRALEFAQDLPRLDINPSGKMAIFNKINKKALDKISQRRGIWTLDLGMSRQLYQLLRRWHFSLLVYFILTLLKGKKNSFLFYLSRFDSSL